MSFDEGASRGLFESVLVWKLQAITFIEESNKVAPQRHSVEKADKCNGEAFSARSHKRIEESVTFGKSLVKSFYHRNK